MKVRKLPMVVIIQVANEVAALKMLDKSAVSPPPEEAERIKGTKNGTTNINKPPFPKI